MLSTTLHTTLRRFFCFGLMTLALGIVASPTLAEKTSDRIFPASTKGYISIENLKELAERWRQTQIGALLNDPLMDAFKEDVKAQLDRRVKDRFGMTFDEIQQLPSGEVAAGMIAIPDKTPGYVLTLDVADRVQETRDYIDRQTKKFVEKGVKKSTEKHGDLEIIVFTFPNDSTAPTDTSTSTSAPRRTTSKAKPAADAPAPPARQAFYLIQDHFLIVSDQLHLMTLISDRMLGEAKNSLADVESYRKVMQRCLDDQPEGARPQIRWYIEPLNYGESIRVLLQGPVVERRRNRPSIFTVLKEQGFDAIQGVGGIVSVKAEDKESVYRFFVYTKKPYRLAMRMLSFPDNTNFTPPTWMPSDIARCTMFYLDPLAIYDNFGSLFDSLVMQGETGVWEDIVKGLEEDPHGPMINLREELIVHLGQRLLGMSKYEVPITTQSESIVIAVELKKDREEEMGKALQKLFGDDTEMQKEQYHSYILWHRLPAEDVLLPNTDVSVPGLVDSTPAVQPTKTGDEAEPMFPSGGVTVAKGCLFVSTNVDYLKAILDRLDDETLLQKHVGQAKEYMEVDRIFASMGLTDKPHFMQFFARTDETLRPTYELIRQGKMPQSQTLLAKVINALTAPEDSENGQVRQQAIDGKNLPEFDKVQHYFGPAGIFGMTEEEGYFFKGFLLEKKAEEQYGPNRKVDLPKEESEETPAEEKKTEEASDEMEQPKKLVLVEAEEKPATEQPEPRQSEKEE